MFNVSDRQKHWGKVILFFVRSAQLWWVWILLNWPGIWDLLCRSLIHHRKPHLRCRKWSLRWSWRPSGRHWDPACVGQNTANYPDFWTPRPAGANREEIKAILSLVLTSSVCGASALFVELSDILSDINLTKLGFKFYVGPLSDMLTVMLSGNISQYWYYMSILRQHTFCIISIIIIITSNHWWVSFDT